MDGLDQELLRFLITNGFQSSQALASHMNIGLRTIQRRIKEMRDSGTFKVIAVPNMVKFGYQGWAKIGIKIDPAFSSQVTQVLADHPAVYFVAHSLGIYDIVIAVAFKSLDELTYFVNYELTNIQGIISKETMILVKPLKYYGYSWPDSSLKNSTNISDGQHFNDIDRYQGTDLDSRILKILMDDGLTPLSKVKERLGIAEGTIRNRINFMKENQLITLEVVPNKEVLEFEAWATIGINTRFSFDDSMLDILIKDPNVYLVSACLGRFDLVIAARFRNIDLLTQFVTIRLVSIPGINSVQTVLHSKPIKYHNIRLGSPVDTLKAQREVKVTGRKTNLVMKSYVSSAVS
jgi:Lrp/AsnC family transcriptional regulator, regulator for asnA, asnC and gidA